MKKISGKFEFSSYDIKSLGTDVLIYFVPIGVLALNQLQNTGTIDASALYGLFISLVIKAGKKYMTDYESKIKDVANNLDESQLNKIADNVWKSKIEDKKPTKKKIKVKPKNN